MRISWITLTAVIAVSGVLAADRVELSGKVLDPSGKPIEHATVLVYHAGVKKGYSTFCPSCYTDCGKRAITGPTGTFAIQSLDSDLWFELLVVRDGFQPAFIKKVDPATQPPPTPTLLPRKALRRPENVVRGKVVNDKGLPLRDVVVEPVGVATTEIPDGTSSKNPISLYGEIEGLEPVAVTDENGNFEIAHTKPATGMMLKFEARGFAPKLQALSVGTDRKTITVSRGAVIRGRLLDHGKPVANAEIGLIARNRGGFGGNLVVRHVLITG